MEQIFEKLEKLKNKDNIFLLFVCSGNIIRSVMAEFLFKRFLQDYPNSIHRFKIKSGALLYRNSSIDTKTRQVLLKHNFPSELIDSFKPTYLKNKENIHLLEEADLIIAMEKSHLRVLPKIYRDKAILLTDLDPSISIPDPFDSELSIYFDHYDKINLLLIKFLEILKELRIVY
ncbi:MAG: arsenate reductase/protein-tyrosine-phosphatase family protein [Candidatus Helarchaeota archaeon]